MCEVWVAELNYAYERMWQTRSILDLGFGVVGEGAIYVCKVRKLWEWEDVNRSGRPASRSELDMAAEWALFVA